MTDNDLADSGNMWQLKYQSAHRELVVANRAVQRLSARCKKLREENKKLRGPVDALTVENFDCALAAYQHGGKIVDRLTLKIDAKNSILPANNIAAWVNNQSQLGTIFRDGKICQGSINMLNPNIYGDPKP